MEHDRSDTEALVIGAGPAGLAAAVQLRRRGVDTLVLERSDTVGPSWRERYDQLRLNSLSWMSAIPHAPMPLRAGRWPTAGAYVEYLEATVERWGIDVCRVIEAQRIDSVGPGYEVSTRDRSFRAPSVVVATGYDRVWHMPDWPGRADFGGRLIHAAQYRNPDPFIGRDVLVVGCGNTGTELAVQLARAGATRVRVGLRTPPNLMPRQIYGVPVQALGALLRHQPDWLGDASARLLQRLTWGDLSRFGLLPAPMGVASEIRHKGLGPVVDTGFVDEVRAGRVEIGLTVVGFSGNDVLLADGTSIRPDVVIAATGYRHGLEDLVGHLGVLTDKGRPQRVDGGALPHAPGLHFNGYWLPVTGQLTAMRATSRRIGRQVARRRRHGARRCGSGVRLEGLAA